jgi:hypothetical protein
MKPVGYLHEWEYPDEPGMVYREFLRKPPQSSIVRVTPLYAIPEGWTVVPKDPTDDMAGDKVKRGFHNPERTEKMVGMYRAGITLAKIGAHYGLTRERVRQILTNDAGISREEGGVTKRLRDKKFSANAKKSANFMLHKDVDLETYRVLQKNGATTAFGRQKQSAIDRGIEWRLSLGEWWSIWSNSNKWLKRGRNKGEYVMSRILNIGGYSVGNVHIQTCQENGRESTKRWLGKSKNYPRGIHLIYPAAKKPYLLKIAHAYYGYFETAEEAEQIREDVFNSQTRIAP